MLELHKSSQFKADYKLMKKRGYDMQLLKDVVAILQKPAELPEQNKDHRLIGNLKEFRECHILPDWLLMYCVTKEGLYLSRTGTHSDLFKK
ncbi:MAG: type II toxin-antitoxin system YafQ family toxin [Treponema sp.]|nr:type II toxin-antitoxin system YafQ family toxin [Treponema sp.]